MVGSAIVAYTTAAVVQMWVAIPTEMTAGAVSNPSKVLTPPIGALPSVVEVVVDDTEITVEVAARLVEKFAAEGFALGPAEVRQFNQVMSDHLINLGNVFQLIPVQDIELLGVAAPVDAEPLWEAVRDVLVSTQRRLEFLGPDRMRIVLETTNGLLF